MADERPLSDFISSVEQVDVPEDKDIPMEEGEEERTAPKKSKAFPIIVGILLLLIIIAGGYYVYDSYFVKDIEETEEDDDGLNPEESTLEFRDFFIDQENGKILYVKLPISECEDFEYTSVNQENSEVLVWEEKGEENCPSSYGVEYFKDEASMTRYYSKEAKYPLETVTVNDVEYEIVFENGTYVQAGKSGSILYQKEPVTTVDEYEAFKVLFVYGILPDLTSRISNPETSIATYCAFDVSKLGNDVGGYLVFNGSDNDTDYCEILENSENFELRIEQLGLL